MTEGNEAPKLTGSSEKLYAGKRRKNMAEESFEIQPQRAQGMTPAPIEQPILEVESLIGDQGTRSPDQNQTKLGKAGANREDKRQSLLDSLNQEDVAEIIISAQESKNPMEQAAGIMLMSIKWKTEQQEMDQWATETLFDTFKDWQEFSQEMQDEEDKDVQAMSPELQNTIDRVNQYVRGAIVETVGDREGNDVLATFFEDRETWHKKNNEKKNIVDGNKIKDEGIQQRFAELCHDDRHGAFDNVEHIQKTLELWRAIDTSKLGKDPFALKAIAKAQEVLDERAREARVAQRDKKSTGIGIHRMDVLTRAAVEESARPHPQKEELPVQHIKSQEQLDKERQARDQRRIEASEDPDTEARRIEHQKLVEQSEREAVEKRRKMTGEELNTDLEQRLKQHSYFASESRAGAERTGHDEGSDFMRKEQKWVDHKLKWDSLKELESRLAYRDTDEQGRTIIKFEDDKGKKIHWDEYGWKDDDREKFVNALAGTATEDPEVGLLSGDYGHRLNNARLLAREYLMQGYTAEAALTHASKNPDSVIMGELGKDRDEIMRIFTSDINIETIKENNLREDPKTVYELGWQIAASDQLNFGEYGEYPVWERRVSREARGDNVFITKDNVEYVQDQQGRLIELNDEGKAIRVIDVGNKEKNTKYLKKAFLNKENQLVDLQGNVIRIDEDGNCTDASTGKIVKLDWNPRKDGSKDHVTLRKHENINKEHFLYWQRDRSIWLDDYYEQDKIDFIAQVTVLKNTPNQLSIQRMLDLKERVFNGTFEQPNEITGEYEKYADLWHQSLEEAYALTEIRNFHWDYVKAPMHDDTQLAQKILQLFYDNHFTKPTIGKTLWYFTEMIPEKFKTLATSDGKMGAVINTQFLSFYHLSNFEQLREVLSFRDDETGEKDYDAADLFNLFDLRRHQEKIYTEKRGKYGESIDPNEVFDLRDNGTAGGVKVADVFDLDTGRIKRDANGKISLATKAKFINMINYFTSPTPNTLQKKTVQEAIRYATTRMHNLNSVEYDDNGVAKRYTKAEEDMALLQRQRRRDLDRSYAKGEISKEEYERKRRDGTGGAYVPLVKEGDIKTIMKPKDDNNSVYSQIAAKHMVRWTGAAAQNDIGRLGDPADADYVPGYPVGYDALTRMMHFGLYREKMLSKDPRNGRVRGGQAGNPYTIAQFKNLLVNPILGILTEVAYPLYDREGNQYNAKASNIKKPILFVLEELNSQRKKVDREERRTRIHRNGTDRSERNRDMSKPEFEANEQYRRVAAQLTFPENSERHWLANQLERATKIYKETLDGTPLSLQGEHAPEVGYTLNREKLQKEINSKISAWRYLTETYDLVNFSMPVWGFDLDIKQWRYMSVAETLFGADMLSRPEFMTDGFIDPKKIHENKFLLYKQALLTYFAGEFIAYRQMRKWSTDPRHDFAWYDNIIDLIEKIPAGIGINQKDMNDVTMESFFSHHEMEWFRNRTGTTFKKLYGMALLKALVLGDVQKHDGSVYGGISEILGRIISEVARR